MELTKSDIRKISKAFKITEESIKQFLQEEERLLRIRSFKESFLKITTPTDQILILKDWESDCKKFHDFEEFYIIVPQDLLNVLSTVHFYYFAGYMTSKVTAQKSYNVCYFFGLSYSL